MPFDYSDLENRFDCACQEVITNLSQEYKSSYRAGGPGMLNTFLEFIKSEFDRVETNFIEQNKIFEDHEAVRRIRAIAKKYAKKCVTDYGKLK